MVDQNAPHESRRYGEEVPFVAPILMVLLDNSQIGFVDQRGRLERMIGTFGVQNL